MHPVLFTNMKRSNRARPRRKESRFVVWLTTSTLKLWNEHKRNLGFTGKSNSEFAEALLNGIVPGEGQKGTSRSESRSHNNQQTSNRRKLGSTVANVSPILCKSHYFVANFVCCYTQKI